MLMAAIGGDEELFKAGDGPFGVVSRETTVDDVEFAVVDV
jgi:hypothetical protein